MPICLLIGEDGLELWVEYIRIQCFLLIYKGRITFPLQDVHTHTHNSFFVLVSSKEQHKIHGRRHFIGRKNNVLYYCKKVRQNTTYYCITKGASYSRLQNNAPYCCETETLPCELFVDNILWGNNIYSCDNARLREWTHLIGSQFELTWRSGNPVWNCCM